MTGCQWVSACARGRHSAFGRLQAARITAVDTRRPPPSHPHTHTLPHRRGETTLSRNTLISKSHQQPWKARAMTISVAHLRHPARMRDPEPLETCGHPPPSPTKGPAFPSPSHPQPKCPCTTHARTPHTRAPVTVRLTLRGYRLHHPCSVAARHSHRPGKDGLPKEAAPTQRHAATPHPLHSRITSTARAGERRPAQRGCSQQERALRGQRTWI
jgi:hypothetical protein